MSQVTKIKRALISVFDKSGLKDLAVFLRSEDILVISTGKTAQFLRDQGLIVTDVSTVGKFPEILDGRVKTLNPRIYAGILCDRDKEDHRATLQELDIAPIDLVVTNLYPFAAVAQSKDFSLADLVENVDIGGPSMLRAAAKNFASVTTLHSPEQYAEFIAHYQIEQGTTLAYRKRTAQQVFAHTAQYDLAIAQIFSQQFELTSAHEQSVITLTNAKRLRYGENPHQQGLMYRTNSVPTEVSLAKSSSLGGKELSYNNLLDSHAAIWSLRCLLDHQKNSQCGAIVIKHGVPCGAALALTSYESIKKAVASDETSAFGGIAATNMPFDKESAQAIESGFFEVIIAPSFTDDARIALANKKNLRLLAIDNLMTGTLQEENLRSIFGGVLKQTQDTTLNNHNEWTVVTKEKPSSSDFSAMDFAFRVAKATPSNAITIATSDHLLGIGSGQPNRIQSVKLAIGGAQERGFDTTRAALASDAFFPFDDCITYAHAQGIRLIIQPGGSIRDKEIISTANRLGICMIFTHRRHFRH